MRMLEEGWAARGCSCSQSRVTLLPGLVLDHSHAPFCRECPFAGNVFGNQPDQQLLRVSPGCVQKSLGSEQGMCSKPQCPPVPGLVPLADVLKTIWGGQTGGFAHLAVSVNIPTFLNLHGKAFLQLPSLRWGRARLQQLL